MRDHVVAVDIGTASARAGIFDQHGRLLAKARYPIMMQRPRENHAEHDSEDIWQAACAAVRDAVAASGLVPERIAAIGFEIGREAGRGRGWQYGEIRVVDVIYNKKGHIKIR